MFHRRHNISKRKRGDQGGQNVKLNVSYMGILDFFKRGKEQPIEQRPSASPGQSTQRPAPSAGTSGSSPSGPASREYTIQPGDSLSKIAKKYYGNAAEWQKIHEANKSKIKDPNMIFPGQKIVIP